MPEPRSSGLGCWIVMSLPGVGARNGCVCVSWWRSTRQLRLDGGSVPSSGVGRGRVQRDRLADGEARCGGRGVDRHLRRRVAGVDPQPSPACDAAPWLSRTVSVAVKVPAAV